MVCKTTVSMLDSEEMVLKAALWLDLLIVAVVYNVSTSDREIQCVMIWNGRQLDRVSTIDITRCECLNFRQFSTMANHPISADIHYIHISRTLQQLRPRSLCRFLHLIKNSYIHMNGIIR